MVTVAAWCRCCEGVWLQLRHDLAAASGCDYKNPGDDCAAASACGYNWEIIALLRVRALTAVKRSSNCNLQTGLRPDTYSDQLHKFIVSQPVRCAKHRGAGTAGSPRHCVPPLLPAVARAHGSHLHLFQHTIGADLWKGNTRGDEGHGFPSAKNTAHLVLQGRQPCRARGRCHT